MKTMKKIFSGRVLSIVLLLALVATVLVSCGGQAAPVLNCNKDKLSFESESDFAKHALSPGELKQIADLLVGSYSAEFDGQEILVAADRGYDMTVESGNEAEKDYSKDNGLSVAAYKNLIKKANEKASNKLTNAELDKILAKIDAAKTEQVDADVDLLIDSMKIEVKAENAGLWDGLLMGIGAVLNWITTYLGFGNYVLGICVFAVLIEILMIPFAIKQQKNSIKQAKLRPKEMAIKNKYKGRNDQPTMQKMQAEIQELYQRENFSPASGCLPLLVQLPIIMILYYIVVDPLHYVLGQGAAITGALNTFASTARAAGGLGLSIDSGRGTIELLSKIKEAGGAAGLESFEFFSFGEGVLDSLGGALGAIPNFNVGPLNFGMTPAFDGGWERLVLLSIPVLTFLTYFVSAKLNRKLMYQSVANEGMDARQVACSNTMMDITMPAMSAFFTMAVPAVIGVYWAFRSWLGLLKSFIVSRAMPLPKFTEEDYKAAAKEMAGKKAPVKKSERAGAVRSLHYIDDEDFEDTRERGLARRAAIEEREKAEQESKAKSTPFGAAPMKDDKKNDKKEEKKDETDASANDGKKSEND